MRVAVRVAVCVAMCVAVHDAVRVEVCCRICRRVDCSVSHRKKVLQHPARSIPRTLIEHPYLAHTFLLANPPNCVGGEMRRVRETGRENVCSRHQKKTGLLRFVHAPCYFSHS